MEDLIYNLDNYDYEIINNNLIIKTKEYEISKEDLLNTDLNKSTIKNFIENNEIFPLSYKGILRRLLIKFSAKKLKEISLFKLLIKDGEIKNNGYFYLEKINISYHGLCNNDCIKEIINLIEYLDIKFEIKIKLSNGIILIYKK